MRPSRCDTVGWMLKWGPPQYVSFRVYHSQRLPYVGFRCALPIAGGPTAAVCRHGAWRESGDHTSSWRRWQNHGPGPPGPYASRALCGGPGLQNGYDRTNEARPGMLRSWWRRCSAPDLIPPLLCVPTEACGRKGANCHAQPSPSYFALRRFVAPSRCPASGHLCSFPPGVGCSRQRCQRRTLAWTIWESPPPGCCDWGQQW